MAKVNLDIADRLDITCRQGDTFELTLTLKDSDGTGLPLSTDHYSFLMQVRASSTVSRIPESSDGSSEGIVIGSVELGRKGPVNFTFNNIDDNGNVTLFLSAADMAKVPSGRYKYDFQYKVNDTQKTVLEGSFKINADISKVI